MLPIRIIAYPSCSLEASEAVSAASPEKNGSASDALLEVGKFKIPKFMEDWSYTRNDMWITWRLWSQFLVARDRHGQSTLLHGIHGAARTPRCCGIASHEGSRGVQQPVDGAAPKAPWIVLGRPCWNSFGCSRGADHDKYRDFIWISYGFHMDFIYCNHRNTDV